MPTDTYQGVAAVATQWDMLGDCGGWNDVIQGTICPSHPAYGDPFAKSLNTVGGNQVSGIIAGAGVLPATMVISQVQVVIRFWRTAVYAGTARFFIKLGSQTSYGLEVAPGSPTDVFSGAIARPGGGSWTRADIANAVFGLETTGSGPWNGEQGSGGELRCRNFRIQVTYVTVSPPVADFSGTPTTVFEGDTVAFSDLSAGGPTSWDWDFGDGTAHGTTQNPNHVYATQPAPAPNNKDTVVLIATNVGGSNTKTRTNYITIWKTTDPIVADFTGTPVSGDADLTVQFTDASTGYITSWDWDFGDGSPHDITQNPSHKYTVPGVYTVTLIASNIHVNNTKVRTNYVTVTDPRPTPDFTGTPVSGQRPLTVQFTSSVTNGKEVTSYAWTFGDGATSILQNPSHIYTAPGTYTVTLTESNSHGSHVVTKTNYITVTAQTAAADFSGDPLLGYAPLEVFFRDLSTGDVTTWEWNFGDSTPVSNLQHPTHVYRAAGTYTVTLIVNKSTANTDTEAKTGYVTVLNTTSYGRFFDELKDALMESQELDICSAFTDFGGISKIIDQTYDRVCRFILETGLLRKEGTATATTTGLLFALPSDLIRLLRVEADGYRIEPMDSFQADMTQGAWEGTNGELQGFIFEPSGNSLEIELVPKQASNPTIKVLYLYAPARPTKPSNCFSSPDPWPAFPLPYLFWWIIRFGVLADILKMEGPFYDIARATAAEQMWKFGVETTKLLMQEGSEDGL